MTLNTLPGAHKTSAISKLAQALEVDPAELVEG
jgi:hypothetical protein